MAKSEAVARKRCPQCDGAGYVKEPVEEDDTFDKNGRRRIITGGYVRIA